MSPYKDLIMYSCCELEVAKCADWLERHGYRDAAEKIRRGYPTPGNPK